MSLIEQLPNGPIHIQAIDDHSIKINGTTYAHGVMILSAGEVLASPVETADAITPDALTPLLEGSPELVLIGTGKQHVFLPPECLGVFYMKGIGVEVMTTSSAAHTFSLLALDERRVAALLIL